jgi:hypothetical protein
MLKSLRLLPEILYELKSLNSILNNIRLRQIEIRDEVQSVVSEIGAIQACLDITIVPCLENISNNSDRTVVGPSRPIPQEGPPIK